MLRPTASQLARGLARQTADSLGLAIVRGDFEPGAVLPAETELAERFGVGRGALREAVKVVAAKGLIRTARRYGSRVCPKAEWNLLDRDVLAWHVRADPAGLADLVVEITELRETIEPQAAALAAKRATRAEAARIVGLAEALAVTEPDAAFETDIAFHLAVLDASRNRLLRAFGQSLDVLLRAQFAISRDHLTGEARYRPDQRHLDLARAIESRDPERAREASRAMFRTIRRVIAKAADPASAARPRREPSPGSGAPSQPEVDA